MTDLKRVLGVTLALAAGLFLIPLFAMFGLAILGVTIVAGLIGSAILSYKVKQHQSKFAKAYTSSNAGRFS